jgi:hypothetical protein
MLWLLLAILIGIWLFGLVLDVAGGLIHLVLVVALIVLIYNFVTSRRSTA